MREKSPSGCYFGNMNRRHHRPDRFSSVPIASANKKRSAVLQTGRRRVKTRCARGMNRFEIGPQGPCLSGYLIPFKIAFSPDCVNSIFSTFNKFSHFLFFKKKVIIRQRNERLPNMPSSLRTSNKSVAASSVTLV